MWDYLESIVYDEAETYAVYGSEIQRKQIHTVTFLDTLAEKPEDALDISPNGTVFAWFKPDGNGFDMFVAAEGGINAEGACQYLFAGYTNLMQISFNGSFHTDYAKTMHGMFIGCRSLKTLDLSDFRTGQVEDMGLMFNNCINLESINISGFDTSKVTNMNMMFCHCQSLWKLDVSSFDTAAVTDMSYMFSGCPALEKEDIVHFDIRNVTSMAGFTDSSLWENEVKKNISQTFLNTVTREEIPEGDPHSYALLLEKPVMNCVSLTVWGEITNGDTDYLQLYVRTLEGQWLHAGDVFFMGTDRNSETFVFAIPISFDAYFVKEPTEYSTEDVYYRYRLEDAEIISEEAFAKYKNSPATGSQPGENGLQKKAVPESELENELEKCKDDPDHNYVNRLKKPLENCTSLTLWGAITEGNAEYLEVYVYTVDEAWIHVGNLVFGDSSETTQMIEFDQPLSIVGYMVENPSNLGVAWSFDLRGAEVLEGNVPASAQTWENNLLMDDSSPAYSGQAIDESYVLGSKILRKQVRTITFQDTMSGKPNDAFDVSYNDDGSVMAWFNKYSDDQYDLIIAAEGGINARYASRRLFMGYTKLTQITFNDAFHTEQAKSMRGMFESCHFLEELDLSSFDTAAVMDMSFMFSGCESLKNVDVSSFNTASVTDMRYMFSECSELKEVNVSSFDTSKVTDMSYMFHGCKALKHVDISRFDTSKVTNFSQFSDAPLWEFGTEKKISASALKATFGVSEPNGAYNGAYVLKKPVKNCTSITLPRNYQALIRVHTLDGRWVRVGHNHSGGRTIRFAVPLSFDAYRDVPEITSATVVEGYTPYVSQETGPAAPGGNTSANAWENNLLMAGNNMQSVFGSEIRKANIRTVTFLDSLDGKQENAWDVSYHKDGSVLAWYTRREDKFYDLYVAAEGGINAKYACKNLFKDYIHLKQITFHDAFHTEQAEQMDSMFEGCRELAKLDLSTFDTSAAKSMRRMFVNCYYLEELDLSSFDTSAVIDMCSMFEGCGLMKKLNISSFDTSSVTDVSYMFKNCFANTSFAQKNLDLSQFDFQKVTDISGFTTNTEIWGETKPAANNLEVTKETLPEGDQFAWAYVLKEPIKNCASITLMHERVQHVEDVYVRTLDGRWIRVGRQDPNSFFQYKYSFAFSLSFDAYYAASKIIIADVYADGDSEEQAETEATTAPDDTHFTVSEKDNVVTITAKDLKITVKDDKEVTITLSGLDLKEEYVTNQASSEKNYLEYGWVVRMTDGKTSYEVGTYSWAFDPGKEETVKLDIIPPCFYVNNSSGFNIAYMDGLKMTHTADSITWKYKMTPGYIFDFRNATEFTVSVTDSPANIHDWHTYTRK